MERDPIKNVPRLFTFYDLRHERLFMALQHIGPAPADFFRDACYLMSRHAPITASTTHLVAHLLREVNGAIIDVVSTIGDPNVVDNQKAGDLTKLAAALKYFDMSDTDDMVTKWRRFLKGKDCFNRYAHRSDLSSVRERTSEFDQWFEEAVRLFDFVLDRYQARFLNITDYIDAIINQDAPPRDIRRRIPATILAYGYLFTRLSNPRWILPLKQKGFFELPAEVQQEPAESFTNAYWPQGQYLKNMSATSNREVQSQVLDIMLKVGKTGNYFIHADFVESALAMPVDMAAKWAQHEAAWLSRGNNMQGFVEEKYGRLIAKLATEGRPEPALGLRGVGPLNNK